MSKIRIRHAENEIEVDGTDEFIRKQLEHFYAQIGSNFHSKIGTSLKQELLTETKGPKSGKTQTPAEFYKSKGKSDGLSQVLIFAKFLEEHRKVIEFSKGEVNAVAAEAKISKDIHSQYFTNAVKQGLLRAHANGKYSLTLSAEELLAAM
jgi:hypothetical protein